MYKEDIEMYDMIKMCIRDSSVGDDLCNLLVAVLVPCFWSFIHIFWMQVQRIDRNFLVHVSSGDVFDVQHRTYGRRCCA